MNELLKKMKPYLPFILALTAGAIMPYAFSPYDIGIACIASCALLLWCLTKQPTKKAFLIGWCYGLGMFGLGVNWIYVSIHDYGDAAPILAMIITGLFILGMSLYPALMAALLNRYFPRNDNIRCLLVFPALWVIFEMIRGYFLTGFPWLFAGYSQMGSHLRAFAPYGSIWAVSWSAVFVGAVLYKIVDYFNQGRGNKKERNGLFLTMLIIWGIAFGLNQYSFISPTNKSLTVALVQGNIPQLMRWDPKQVASIVETYETLTLNALTANLIVWPEGAIPIPLPLSSHIFQDMDDLMKSHNTALFAGVPSELSDKTHFYNSLVGVGLGGGIYHKEHLVPFGEYVPFEKWLRGLIGFFNLPMSSFEPGPSDQKPLFAQGFRFAPAICYEIAYPIFVQEMSKNADFIITVSNDTWFGNSIGPAQHLQIAQFRALETGKYVIRATNTGYTAIIDPKGEIQDFAKQFEPVVLTGTITQMEGQTLWVRFGIWPLLGALALAMGLGFYLKSRQKG